MKNGQDISCFKVATVKPVSDSEALQFWIKFGFINFGGPAEQKSLMHKEVVGRRQWTGEDRFQP